MSAKVLICTLGVTAPVISETVNLLAAQGKTIDKVIVIHTSFKDVLHKQTRSGKEIGLLALRGYMERKYSHMKVESIDLGIDDILSSDDNEKLMHTLMSVFQNERRNQNIVYASIAGGRKTMSSAALFAAYVIGCNGIFHILVNGKEEELTDRYGFDVPLDYLSLIEVPAVDLSPMLNTVIQEIDVNNEFDGDVSEYLLKQGKLEAVFNLVNQRLQASLDQRKLREEYNRRCTVYQKMNRTVLSILQARIRESAVMKPQYEGRVKTFESFTEKVSQKSRNGEAIDDPFERIHDLSGVRLITYFEEDFHALEKIIDDLINSQVDFESHPDPDKAKKVKKPSVVGYTGIHYVVRLLPDRTALVEYKDLAGIWCEIQLKTLFDHAWSQVEHRLRFKSEEYQKMSNEQQDRVDRVFVEAAKLLNETKTVFSSLHETYDKFRRDS